MAMARLGHLEEGVLLAGAGVNLRARRRPRVGQHADETRSADAFLVLRVTASSARKPTARSLAADFDGIQHLHTFSFQGRKTARSANVFVA